MAIGIPTSHTRKPKVSTPEVKIMEECGKSQKSSDHTRLDTSPEDQDPPWNDLVNQGGIVITEDVHGRNLTTTEDLLGQDLLK
jgi:hypothetical protein